MNDKLPNILITGSSGFVGRALIKNLAKDSNLFLVSRDKNFSYPGAKVFCGDLADQAFSKKIILGVDTVFYLAGYKKNIAHHVKYPNDFVFGNIEPLISFLRAAKDSSVKSIIYLSSTNVGLYKEGEKDGYVVGKYVNELILKTFSDQYGIDVKIVRSAGVYGPGDNFDSETANFIPSIINKVYESVGEVSVWGTGKRKMQFIFIDDLISNLVGVSKSGGNFFVVGNPETLFVNDIVGRIIELSGKKLIIKNDLTKPDKSTQLFEFNNVEKLKFSFDKGLAKTVDYYKTLGLV